MNRNSADELAGNLSHEIVNYAFDRASEGVTREEIAKEVSYAIEFVSTHQEDWID